MAFSQGIKKMWNARDELSPRNFRAAILPMLLVFPLSVVIGDLRFLDQKLVVLGIDSNNLIMMIYGLGFLPVFFAKERHMIPLLRVSVMIQAVLLVMQLLMGPGLPRLFVYLVFHGANGVSTACGLYLFSFMLNNVERLFSVAVTQLYYAFSYLFLRYEPVAAFFRTFGSAAVMLALVGVAFSVRRPSRTTEAQESNPGARASGVSALIVLNMIYYVITLMAMYIEYQETTVTSALYGAGALVSLAVIVVVMLIFNYSALHLWSLCLVCSVLGIGALHYVPAFTVNAGSLFYGMGEGLGFMILFYLMGGALKRSGSFKLLRLWCLFLCVNYVVISGIFYFLYDSLNAPNLSLAFPAVLVLALTCFLFSPALQKRLFQTDWTDGYHMADMPLYAHELAMVERADETGTLGLTPREKEVFTMLLTEASPKQIAETLRISNATVNFHSKNLYRKLGIQSRTELFAKFSGK